MLICPSWIHVITRLSRWKRGIAKLRLGHRHQAIPPPQTSLGGVEPNDYVQDRWEAIFPLAVYCSIPKMVIPHTDKLLLAPLKAHAF
jgi:hypothetical protein